VGFLGLKLVRIDLTNSYGAERVIHEKIQNSRYMAELCRFIAKEMRNASINKKFRVKVDFYDAETDLIEDPEFQIDDFDE